MTILYVTHDQIEAMTLADKIVIMRDGHIEQVGTPEEVFARPRNTFVATFIGTPAMNLVAATAKDGRLYAKDFSVPVPPRLDGLVSDGLDVQVGIRPSGISIADSGSPDAVSAEVGVTEFLGTEALLDLRVGSEEMVAEVPANLRPGEDVRIHVRFDAESLHIFHAETGLSLDA